MMKFVIGLTVALLASTAFAKPYLQYASAYGYLGDPTNSQHHAQVCKHYFVAKKNQF